MIVGTGSDFSLRIRKQKFPGVYQRRDHRFRIPFRAAPEHCCDGYGTIHFKRGEDLKH